MLVKGYARAGETCMDVDNCYRGSDLMALAAELDYLVIVLPNTEDTCRIVDAALLDALPPRAIIVNVGRGSAVDEAALRRSVPGELPAPYWMFFRMSRFRRSIFYGARRMCGSLFIPLPECSGRYRLYLSG